MSKNIISPEEFGRRINQLMTESIPVIAFFVSESGANADLYGFVDSLTAELGLIVSSTQGMPSISSTLGVPLGNPIGDGCVFTLGTIDEVNASPERREELAIQSGNTVLGILLPSGARLNLFFTA